MELRVESDPTLVITQEHHYYPFGMNLSGIERQGNLMYQFNGMVEKEQAFDLELYETPFRSYDAQLGRFWQVEPLADIYCSISMYQFAYNNPVSFNDPSGLNPIGDPPDKEEERDNSGTSEAQGEIESAGQIIPVDSSPKIGAGGYTWDLGNTRANPYSMGGTPGQGPGRIQSSVKVRVVNLDAADHDLSQNAMKRAENTLNGIFGEGAFTFEFVSPGAAVRDRKHYEAIIVIGQDGKAVKQYITENLNRGFGRQMSAPDPETTTGWRKGTTYTGPYRTPEQEITFLNKETRVGGPIIAISSSSIRNNFIADGDNINTTAEQYLAYTMLHGLGHGAGIGERHINSRWLNFNIPSIMMGGSRNYVPHSLAAMRESNNFYNAATSFNNNIIYYQFMFNYYIMGQLWGNEPTHNLGPFSRFPKNLLQYID